MPGPPKWPYETKMQKNLDYICQQINRKYYLPIASSWSTLYITAPVTDTTAFPTNFGASRTPVITEHLCCVGIILINELITTVNVFMPWKKIFQMAMPILSNTKYNKVIL
jgi:hypothetical protein